MTVIVGWSLLLVMWETGVVAVLLAASRLWWPRASAARQYATALAATTAIVVLAVATPLMLTIASSTPAQNLTAPQSFVSGPASELSTPVSLEVLHTVATRIGVPADNAARAVAVVWTSVALLLAARLLGGWWATARLRRRATPVMNEGATAAAARLHVELSLQAPVVLLESPSVEAPAVVGWRAPALLLPDDLSERLSPVMIEALLAHELAHVKRQDYVVNLVQSWADVLLWFSPAFAWMSRRVRETREYCCDDIAVQRCADPRAFVEALTTLASLAAVHRAHPAVPAVGPRLIVRIRRLLKGPVMPSFAGARWAGLIASLVLLTATGTRIVDAAHASASALAGSSGREAQEAMPFGYATEQPGSAVVLAHLHSSAQDPAHLATLRNTSSETVVGVQFVAVLEQLRQGRVRIYTSEERPVRIAPGGSVDVAPMVVTVEQLQTAAADANGPVQLFVGLARVRYENGAEWSVTPNPEARNGRDALSIEPPEIPRALVGPGAVVRTDTSMCYDDRHRSYSLGAVVGIRAEPGHVARCADGQWIDEARTASGRSAVRLEIQMEVLLPNGATPQLTVLAGTAATVQLSGAGSFSFVPTLKAGDPSVVVVEIFDLSTTPRLPPFQLEVSIGGEVVRSLSTPEFGVRITRVRKMRTGA